MLRYSELSKTQKHIIDKMRKGIELQFVHCGWVKLADLSISELESEFINRKTWKVPD